MVKRCAHGMCNSDYRYRHKEHMKNVYFVRFPNPKTEPERCKKWVHACSRANFSVSDVKPYSYLCCKHFFDSGGPTKEHPDPVPLCQDAKVPETKAVEVNDVSLKVVSDQARVMLEHSYASLYGSERGVEDEVSILYADVDKPFRGFSSTPGVQLFQISTGIAISGNDIAKLSATKNNNKHVQQTQPNPPAKKKRRKRRKRCVLLKKKSHKSAAVKQYQRKVSPRKKQTNFTFVDVQKDEDETHILNLNKNLTERSESFEIKEEIPDRCDSDTVSVGNSDTISVPSPRMYLDSSSDGEMESISGNIPSIEFVRRTTIVRERNLPDNPEYDPLSFASGDFHIKTEPVEDETSELASNSGVSAISFSFAPKEEPEDKFVPCSDLINQSKEFPSEPQTTENSNSSCLPALEQFPESSEFITGDVCMKQEHSDDLSDTAKSDSSYVPDNYFSRINVSVNGIRCYSMNSATDDYRTVNQHPKFYAKYGGKNKTSVIPDSAYCGASSFGNVNREKSNFKKIAIPHRQNGSFQHSNKVVHTNKSTLQQNSSSSSASFSTGRSDVKIKKDVIKHSAERKPVVKGSDTSANNLVSQGSASVSTENRTVGSDSITLAKTSSGSVRIFLDRKDDVPCAVQSKVKVRAEAAPYSSAANKLPSSGRNGVLGSAKSVSSEDALKLAPRVKRRVFLISPENSTISAFPKLAKIVHKPAPEPHKSLGSEKNINFMSQCVPLASTSVQTNKEMLENLSYDKKDITKNIKFQDDSKTTLISTVGKQIKTSPKLVHVNVKECKPVSSRGSPKKVGSSCKSESGCIDSTSLSCNSEEEKPFSSPRTSVVSEKKGNTAQRGRRGRRKSRFSRKQVKSAASRTEIVVSSSEEVAEEIPREIIHENSACEVPSKDDQTVFQVDEPSTSVAIVNQNIGASSQVETFSDDSLNSAYTQLSHYSNATTATSLSSLLSHRSSYMSTVEKLTKRVRFLSRLKTIFGSKNSHPYKM